MTMTVTQQGQSTVDIPEGAQPKCPRVRCSGTLRAAGVPVVSSEGWTDVQLRCDGDECEIKTYACWTTADPSSVWVQPTIREVLHRVDRPLVHLRDIPVGAWVWDDRNDEPAQMDGWYRGAYTLTWLSGGSWCAWDLAGCGRSSLFEVLDVESVDWSRVNGER